MKEVKFKHKSWGAMLFSKAASDKKSEQIVSFFKEHLGYSMEKIVKMASEQGVIFVI